MVAGSGWLLPLANKYLFLSAVISLVGNAAAIKY